MTAMYDGIDTRVPVRCLGCADGIVVLEHQCAGDRPLAPGGGYCECPRPGCGQRDRQRSLTTGTTVPA